MWRCEGLVRTDVSEERRLHFQGRKFPRAKSDVSTGQDGILYSHRLESLKYYLSKCSPLYYAEELCPYGIENCLYQTTAYNIKCAL
jgi:hypothetical protein